MIGSADAAAFGGRPLVTTAVCQGVHCMSCTASGDQALSATRRRTARVLKTPAFEPTMCSSVCASLPSQHP